MDDRDKFVVCSLLLLLLRRPSFSFFTYDFVIYGPNKKAEKPFTTDTLPNSFVTLSKETT